MDEAEIEAILWDCVQSPTDDDDCRDYQSSGITKLGELIAGQGRRIAELEKRIANLAESNQPTTEQGGPRP